MAFPPRYATVQDIRDRGIPQAVVDDASVRQALDEVSRWVESQNLQIYYPRDEEIFLDGQDHRILQHPDLWPILSAEADITIALQTERTRRYRVADWVQMAASTQTIATTDFSLDTNHPRRRIDKHFGNWYEGSHNYSVDAVWGWMEQVNKVEYTLTVEFLNGDTYLNLSSVAALRRNDVGTMPDGTVLTVVAVDAPNSRITVEGGDFLLTTAAIGATFTRWGQVPGGVRDFVIEALYMGSGAGGAANCPWLKREQTDMYEYEKFSPSEFGMSGGDWWTGVAMIDEGLHRYRRPQYVGMI